ncbi:MAG: UDP-N-acetylmuramate dehydrogenase [Anaerolineae bacterium]|nr:UDP-N-acetylmuramate dehydrogenase [Anaerolineae bacterium]
MQTIQTLLGDRLLADEPLAKYTAARLGGPAEWLYIAKGSVENLAEVMQAAWTQGLPVRVIGGGANILVSDAGVRGLVVVNRVNAVDFAQVDGRYLVTAASGTSLSVLARKCQRRGLSGLEWAVSVPGTVGGAVVNNAGAHGGDMAGILCDALVLDAAEGQRLYSLADLRYDYRFSCLKARTDRRFIVLQATLALTPDAPEAIQARMDGFIQHRKRTQPPGASLGSIFKNPPGDYAGRLIEAAGLKGYAIGGAQVSPVHGNFFINTGQANARDYYALIQHVRAVVERISGIRLETEIEMVGEGFQSLDR